MDTSRTSPKRVLALQHVPFEGVGQIGPWLIDRGHRVTVVRLDESDDLPDPAEVDLLVIMGGPMGVHDEAEHPWLRTEKRFVRSVIDAGAAVLGICLGAQLIAAVMGGRVGPNPVKEIGWSRVEPEDNATAREWLGEAGQALTVFQWHGETFTIPDGATRILRGEYCANQAFVVHGRHLGMQCHVEMTDHIIATWCGSSSAEVSRSAASPAVEPVADIRAKVAANLPALNALADRLYARWVRGLAR